jgi:hypothetical protein
MLAVAGCELFNHLDADAENLDEQLVSPTLEPVVATPSPTPTPVPGAEAELSVCDYNQPLALAWEPETEKGETWLVTLQDDGYYKLTVKLWMAKPCNLIFVQDPFKDVSPAAQLKATYGTGGVADGYWYGSFLVAPEALQASHCSEADWAAGYVIQSEHNY